MPHFDDDETVELLEHITNDFEHGIAGWEELDDGTVVVATYDSEASIDDFDMDEEAMEEVRQMLEDGDAFGVAHYDRRGEQLDALWGMVGYGGAIKAIDGYAEQVDIIIPSATYRAPDRGRKRRRSAAPSGGGFIIR